MSQNRTEQKLTKAEFLARLDSRSVERYGGPMGETVLNDLMKDGVVEAMDRAGNVGLRPIYLAGRRHYRRALQVKRLMSRGISRRDTLKIQLFLRGYGIQPWDVREELTREYVAMLRTLSAQNRSGYFLNSTRNLGLGHRRSLLRNMGPLDPRFLASGLQLDDDTYIAVGRQLKSPRPSGGILDFLTRLLFLDSIDRKLSNEVEQAISQSDGSYFAARDAFRLSDKYLFSRLLGRRIIDDPVFSTVVLIVMLCCVKNDAKIRSWIKVPPLLGRFFLKIQDIIGDAP